MPAAEEGTNPGLIVKQSETVGIPPSPQPLEVKKERLAQCGEAMHQYKSP
jgi:hypothetical protein